MPIFTRSKSRGEHRDKEVVSTKWLSGISVGSWNLGLNFEEEEEVLVNPSNALMIDRSEPPISWRAQQMLLAKAMLEAEEEKAEALDTPISGDNKSVTDIFIDMDSSNKAESTVVLVGTNEREEKENDVQSLKRSVPIKNNVSDRNTVAVEEKEASVTKSNGSWSSRLAKSAGTDTGSTDSTTETQNQFQFTRVNNDTTAGRCVAGGCEGGSKGWFMTGIPAKAGQGEHDGGSLRPPIGMPLITPTQLSYTRDKDQAKATSESEEGERGRGRGRERIERAREEKRKEQENKQLPPMSFLNSHTTTSEPKKCSPTQNKNGRDNATTHATAVFSSSSSITDNGPSFSKGTLHSSSLALVSLAVSDDPLLSSTSSRSSLDSCMNDTAPLVKGVSAANNKNPRSPSSFLASAAILSSDLISSLSSSSSSLFLPELSMKNKKAADIEQDIEQDSTFDDDDEEEEEEDSDILTQQHNITSNNNSACQHSTPPTTVTATASHDINNNTKKNNKNNKNNTTNQFTYINSTSGGRGSCITPLHYSRSYQPRSSSSQHQKPGPSSPSVQVLDLTRNTHSQNLNFPPQILSSSNSFSSFSYSSPSQTQNNSSVSPSTQKRNPPPALTVLTTSSATPSAANPTTPTSIGHICDSNSIDCAFPLLGALNTASSSPSSPPSPIAVCATLRTSLQPQIPVPIPTDYRPSTPQPAGPEPIFDRVNEVVRPVTASSSWSLSAGSSASFNTSHLSPATPTTQSGNLSLTSASPSRKVVAMAARSAAAQKSLMRSGATREQYAPYNYGPPPTQNASYAPSPQINTAPSSSNSSQEFQIDNDIHTLQSMARQREQAEQVSSRGRSDSQSRMQGNYSKGHGKNSSGGGNELLENVFGIYPEKKSMGKGVSVADVVANKLFKWGSKKEAPSTIPTPSRETKSRESRAQAPRSSRHPHPTGFVGGVPQQVVTSHRPSSSHQDQDYHPSQRDEMLHSRASNLDQVKLDELMARQKLLEDRINQLKLERDHLIDLNTQPLPLKAHHEAAVPAHLAHHHQQPYSPNSIQPQPLRLANVSAVPRSPDSAHSYSHSISSAVHARQMAEPLNISMQFPLPPSQQPQQTTYAPQPQISETTPTSRTPIRQDPSATSVHYVSRPLPQPPTDATPPPQYEPPTHSYGSNRSAYRDMKIKLTSPTSGSVMTHDVILEEPIPNPDDDEKYGNLPSPRDDVDAEDILGWFETLKFASTGPRGRGPMTPLPRPEAADNKLSQPMDRDEKKSPVSRQPESATVYYDVKLPLNSMTSPTEHAYDMRYGKKDLNSGRKKRNEMSTEAARSSRDDEVSVHNHEEDDTKNRDSGYVGGSDGVPTEEEEEQEHSETETGSTTESSPYWDDPNFDIYCYGNQGEIDEGHDYDERHDDNANRNDDDNDSSSRYETEPEVRPSQRQRQGSLVLRRQPSLGLGEEIDYSTPDIPGFQWGTRGNIYR
ncbi:hypothetical protein ABW20_dc0103705 [Dactylellina cionopaga]|nr:hypothetical protein ABW20_dc0103705 [Dactylellina cionopaga]